MKADEAVQRQFEPQSRGRPAKRQTPVSLSKPLLSNDIGTATTTIAFLVDLLGVWMNIFDSSPLCLLRLTSLPIKESRKVSLLLPVPFLRWGKSGHVGKCKATIGQLTKPFRGRRAYELGSPTVLWPSSAMRREYKLATSLPPEWTRLRVSGAA